MTHIENFDPAHSGCWRGAPTLDGVDGWSDDQCRHEVDAFFLETKSGDPREALSAFLADMAREMRAQFESFRKLRIAADTVAKANAEGVGSEDAAAKLARADIKAALDAMSLIIRTLEKVDTLQRQIARDAFSHISLFGYKRKVSRAGRIRKLYRTSPDPREVRFSFRPTLVPCSILPEDRTFETSDVPRPDKPSWPCKAMNVTEERRDEGKGQGPLTFIAVMAG